MDINTSECTRIFRILFFIIYRKYFQETSPSTYNNRGLGPTILDNTRFLYLNLTEIV